MIFPFELYRSSVMHWWLRYLQTAYTDCVIVYRYRPITFVQRGIMQSEAQTFNQSTRSLTYCGFFYWCSTSDTRLLSTARCFHTILTTLLMHYFTITNSYIAIVGVVGVDIASILDRVRGAQNERLNNYKINTLSVMSNIDDSRIIVVVTEKQHCFTISKPKVYITKSVHQQWTIFPFGQTAKLFNNSVIVEDLVSNNSQGLRKKGTS